LLTLRPAAAEPGSSCEFERGEARAAWLTPWSDDYPHVVTDLKSGEPMVAIVYVPLCSNDQVDCGSTAAGRAGDLSTNLYWGAGFGAARFFDRPNSVWERVQVSQPGHGVLEQRIYRRAVPVSRWRDSFERVASDCGAPETELLEQYVVLRAIHGDRIDDAVRDFWRGSTEGATVELPDLTAGSRRARAHVVGYAGHNRLMDGLELPSFQRSPKRFRSAPASFVLACYSEDYFGPSLRDAAAAPLVMTRALMAPEGYVIDAVVRALGENSTGPMLRKRVVRAYASWQQIPEDQASLIFSR
jgi:hypothetical protein